MPRIGSHVFNVRDFVKETTQTSGTGAYTLDGVSLPEEGHQSFLTAVGDGEKTLYAVKRGSTWEKAIGTVSAGAPVTLSRDLILGTSVDDSIGADPINWPTTDPKDIYIGSPADLLNLIMGPGEVLWGDVSGGTNTLAVTVDPIVTTYWDGMQVWWRKGDTDNTGNMTIDVNLIGARSLLKALGPVQVPAGEAAASAILGAMYIAAADVFVLISGLKRLGATKGATRIYEEGATWEKPAGLLFIELEEEGGGGSAAGAGAASHSSGGGGGGEYAWARIPASALGATEEVTIGAGGAAPSAGNNAGNAGGTTSFGTLLTAAGGFGAGAFASSASLGGAGGTGGTTGSIGSGVSFHIAGSPGETGVGLNIGGEDRVSALASGGRGGGPLGGGGGRAQNTAVSGNAGGAYGGGGGGTARGTAAGGPGAAGVLIVHEFYS